MFISIFSNAQSDDYDLFLARQFLQNGEYTKAVEYYQSLYQQNPTEYYTDFIDILFQLKDFDKAEKIIKTHYKEVDKSPIFLLDLVNLYLKQNQLDEAEKQCNKVMKELKANPYEIQQIAQKFIQLQQVDFAEKTYRKAKELLKDKQVFNLELADLLLKKNDLQGMLNAYFEEAANTTHLNTVKIGLQKALVDEKAKDEVEKALLKRIQSNKTILNYQELLIWLYMQRNDFEGAILQAKSLDLLHQENGENVLRIARAATIQKDFDAAIKGYQYVINKGITNTWYVTASLELINVKRDKIVQTTNYNQSQLLSLKETYLQFISNYTQDDYNAIQAKIELAQLEAFYLHEIDTAIFLVQPIVENDRIPKELLAKAKLNLGDYYIISDEPWESLLLYTQVEKEQKGNPIGEEAKYRNARLAYYKGEFEWAQTQLKIIKANTTEFISNDAIDLSVFILDNLNSDDTDFALIQFAKADLLQYQNKLNEAEDTLDFILKNYVGTALADDILYLKYKIEKNRQQYDNAATCLQQISDHFSNDILADNALFYLGELYQNFLNDDDKAKNYYEKIILEFKDSTFVIEARKRYRKLRGDI
ncbi:MAG TPA: tetratricopeptide repeat protein [Chitinophagales bacterium]|nr:tetratricopeptide repeat protein [Chitinophagales bacterium]